MSPNPKFNLPFYPYGSNSNRPNQSLLSFIASRISGIQNQFMLFGKCVGTANSLGNILPVFKASILF
jgi:hypothetical protein